MPFVNPKDDDAFEFDAGFLSIVESNNDNWDNMKDINDPTDSKTSSSK
jgi:hypothetical protein